MLRPRLAKEGVINLTGAKGSKLIVCAMHLIHYFIAPHAYFMHLVQSDPLVFGPSPKTDTCTTDPFTDRSMLYEPQRQIHGLLTPPKTLEY